MKDIYHIYNSVEELQSEFTCIVGVKVAQTKIEAYLRTQTNICFTKYFVRNRYLRGEKTVV